MNRRLLNFFITLTFAAGLLTGCGGYNQPPSDGELWGDGIVGGQLVKNKNSDIRRIVLELINIESEQTCTAVYYQKNTLLTAAHCVPQQAQNLIIVDSFSQKNIQAQKIIVHPSYLENQKTGADLAFVIIKEDLIPMNSQSGLKWISPGLFEIPMEQNTLETKNFYMLGFGRTSSEDQQEPQLRSLKLKFQKKLFKEKAGLLRLSQASKKGICFGDSGGPLFAVADGKFQLIGIAKEVRQSSSLYSEECWGEGVWTDLRPLQKELQKALTLELQH